MTQGIVFPLVQNIALVFTIFYLHDLTRATMTWGSQRLLMGLVIGVGSGFISLIPVQLQADLIIDLNPIVLSLVGLFFPGATAILSLATLAIFNYWTADPFTISLIVPYAIALAVGMFWRLQRKRILADFNWFEMLLMSLIVQVLYLLSLYGLAWGRVQLTVTLSMLVIPFLMLFSTLLALSLSRNNEKERDIQAKLQEDILFRDQFDKGNIGIAISSVDKRWIRVNPYVCKMLCFTEVELLNRDWTTLTHPDDSQIDAKQYQSLIDGDIEQYELDKRYLTKNGDIVPVHLTVTCRRVAGKADLVIATLMDMTSLQQAEKLRLDKQEQLELVLNSSELGLWDWDIAAHRIERNAKCTEMLGCDSDSLERNDRLWLEQIEQQDKPAVIRALRAHLKGDTDHYHAEYRLQTFNGGTRWIHDSGKVVSFDKDGRPTRMCGVHGDITETKRAQESMRLAASVYNNSSEAMSVMDDTGRVITVNQAFCEITGFCNDNIIGQHISALKSGRNGRGFYKRMAVLLRQCQRWQGEIWIRNRNGEEQVVWLTINSIPSEERENNRWVALFSDITDKKNSEQLIWQQANYDALTGLPNRRMLLDSLNSEIKRTDRAANHFALLFLDLDGFKEVNDTLGHDIGDLLLVEAAERLKLCVRETDIVARLGGDEFTVVLTGISNAKSVDRVANKILKTLADPYVLVDETTYVSASIGITLYPDDAHTTESLLKNADQAMYAAKDMGRNRFNYFTPSMQESAKYRMRLIQDLRQAVAAQEFEVYYQPIVDLTNLAVYKAEALIRWHHPERGTVSPAEFIPVAEDTGLIIEIGNWVFEQSAKQAAAWLEQHGQGIQISINKSPIQFRDEGADFSEWMKVLSDLKLTGNGVCIEITEGLLLDASMGVSEKLLSYRDAGIQVSLDDFGTGYSSLAYLKKFDIDYLKIDQSFTRNLTSDDNDVTLCEAIIVMAHKLGMKVIAEGVETQEQCDILRQAGCDYGQGYLFSRPLPEQDFAQKYLVQDSVLQAK